MIVRITCADIVPIPQGVPLEIPPPPHTDNGLLSDLIISAVKSYGCIIIYGFRQGSDPWDTHTFVLQRASTNYNGGLWEDVARKETPLPYDRAVALFADRIDRDEGLPGTGTTYYRVVDLGPVQ